MAMHEGKVWATNLLTMELCNSKECKRALLEAAKYDAHSIKCILKRCAGSDEQQLYEALLLAREQGDIDGVEKLARLHETSKMGLWQRHYRIATLIGFFVGLAYGVPFPGGGRGRSTPVRIEWNSGDGGNVFEGEAYPDGVKDKKE